MIGIRLEKRDLITLFGEQYRAYIQKVRMLLPSPTGMLDRNAVSPPKRATVVGP